MNAYVVCVIVVCMSNSSFTFALIFINGDKTWCVRRLPSYIFGMGVKYFRTKFYSITVLWLTIYCVMFIIVI